MACGPSAMQPRTYPHDCPAPPPRSRCRRSRSQLADFMPGMADGLHEHEWREHGGCSGLDDDELLPPRARAGARVDARAGRPTNYSRGRRDHRRPSCASIADMFHPGLGATLTFHCRTLRDATPRGRYLIEVRQCVDNDGPDGAPRTPLDCARREAARPGMRPRRSESPARMRDELLIAAARAVRSPTASPPCAMLIGLLLMRADRRAYFRWPVYSVMVDGARAWCCGTCCASICCLASGPLTERRGITRTRLTSSMGSESGLARPGASRGVKPRVRFTNGVIRCHLAYDRRRRT